MEDHEKLLAELTLIDDSQKTTFEVVQTVSSWDINKFGELYFSPDRSVPFSSAPVPLKVGTGDFITTVQLTKLHLECTVKYRLEYPSDKQITRMVVTIAFRNKENVLLQKKSFEINKSDLDYLSDEDDENKLHSLYEECCRIQINDFEKTYEKRLPCNFLKIETVFTQIYQTTKTTDYLPTLKKSMNKDFQTLYESKDLTDATIEVGAQLFQVHKIIMSARSEVFKAMFSSNMIESKTNCVKIDDVKPKVFEQLLLYIYTDEISATQDTYLDLAYAADKYGVSELKIFCESVLRNNIESANALAIFQYADLCLNKILKDAALDYIIKNMGELSESDRNILKNNPSIFKHFVDKLSLK